MSQAAATSPGASRSLTARVMARFIQSRRRIGTIGAFAVALLLAYHVVVGDNGLNVYKQKLAEDKQLTQEVQMQKQKNERLKQHVDHLKSDPDAIAHEVHQRLLYAGAREVIVLNSVTSEETNSQTPGTTSDAIMPDKK